MRRDKRAIPFSGIFKVALAGLAFAMSWVAAAAQSFEMVNAFPVSVKTDAFKDRRTPVSTSFLVFFPAGELKYLPVDEEVAALLSLAPQIIADHGIHARVVRSSCTPEEVNVLVGVGKGGRIRTEIEISVDAGTSLGTHKITVAYPLIRLVSARVNPLNPISNAEVDIEVLVWRSYQAKVDAEHKAQEELQRQDNLRQQARMETERKAHEEWQRQENLRQQEKARKLHENLQTAQKLALVVVPLASVLYWRRHWLKAPALRVKIHPGEFRQLHDSMVVSRNSKPFEPGTVLCTTWARNFLNRKERIKIELFARDEEPGRESISESSADVLVRAGASVRPGTYVATIKNRAVKIRVSN